MSAVNREVTDAARRLDRALDNVPGSVMDEQGNDADLGEVYAATEDLFSELRRLNLIPAVL